MIQGMELPLLFAFVGGVLTLVSNLMKRMVPLRAFALAANGFFLIDALLAHDRIAMVLQAGLLGINAWRLWDLHRLLKAMEHANAGSPVREWLLPYMKKKSFAAGTVVFRKGDPAHELVYVRDGTMRVVEVGATIGAGSLVGEIGLFTDGQTRTATIVCETPCVCYTMTDEAIYLLYFQNPRVGFYLIRLIVQRLLQDLQRPQPVA